MVSNSRYSVYIIFAIAFLWFFEPANGAPRYPFDGVWNGVITCGDKKSKNAFRTARKIRIKKTGLAYAAVYPTETDLKRGKE